MYYKRIMYNGYNIIVFCTPSMTEEELLEGARGRYQLYIDGRISKEDLTGEINMKEVKIETKEECLKTLENVIETLLDSSDSKLVDIATYDLQAIMSFIDKPEITKEKIKEYAKKTLLDFIEYIDNDGTYQYLKVSHIKLVKNHFHQIDSTGKYKDILTLRAVKDICEEAYREAFKL